MILVRIGRDDAERVRKRKKKNKSGSRENG
jgi:hypothetical protein